MKFSVEAPELAAALQKIKGTIQTRTTMPVLSCARIEASGNALIVTGSDSTNECSVKMVADVEVDGVCAIPASVITNIARVGRSGTVSVDVNNGVAAIKCGRSRYSVTTVSADDYPIMEQESGVSAAMSTRDLMRLFSTTRHAQSTDSARYYMMGTHLHIKGKTLVAAATDGHRCVRITMPTPRGMEPLRPIIIGSGTLALLKSLEAESDSITMRIGASTVSFVCGNVALTGRLVEGTFPDYERVIPPPCDRIIIATEGERIVDGVDALLAIHEGSDTLAIRIGPTSRDGIVMMSASRGREGRQAAVDVEAEGSTASTGVNAAYIKAALDIFPEGAEVSIQQENEGSPINIVCSKAPEITCVVMPMRAADAPAAKVDAAA